MFRSSRRLGRGFTVAVVICLVAVCTVAVYTFRDSLFPTEPTEPPITTTTTTKKKPFGEVDDKVTGVSKTTTVPTTTTTQPPAPDLFVLPLSNTLLAPFSQQLSYNQTMGDWRTHNGADFAGNVGDAVRAVADGTVLSVKEDAVWGWVVRIRHGVGLEATYCGVTPRQGLKAEDTVKTGENIGTLSLIPCELLEKAHLHLEMQENGAFVDPVTIIDKEVKTPENE